MPLILFYSCRLTSNNTLNKRVHFTTIGWSNHHVKAMYLSLFNQKRLILRGQLSLFFPFVKGL